MSCSSDADPPSRRSAPGAAVGRLPLLLRPEPRIRQLLEHAVAHPHLPRHRHPLAIERRAQHQRIVRIAAQRHALIENLLANPCATTGLGERRAPFVGAARLQRAAQRRDHVGRGFGFEDHGVPPRFDRHRIARPPRLVDGLQRHALEIELRPVVAVGRGPAGAGAIVGARGERVVRVGAAMIRKQPRTVAQRRGARFAHDESGHREIARRTRRRQCRERRFRAILGAQLGRAVEPRRHRRVRLRTEFAQILGVFGRQPRNRFRLLHRATQAGFGAIVGEYRRLALAEDALHANRRVGGGARRGHLVVGKAQVRFARTLHRHAHRVGLGHADHTLHERLRLLAAEHRAGRQHTMRVGAEQATRRAVVLRTRGKREIAAHSCRPVLITLMFLKRTGGQPWLTALACDGCPLPSLKVPPNS
jgi:hypothetical protein